MAKKIKRKGAALSLLGSIPFVGKVKKKAKAVKKAAKTLQKKAQTTKKKFKAVIKKAKNKVKKKRKKKKKKKGKVFTKARKLMNNLKKKDLVKKFKKIMKKEVLSAKATLKEIRKPISKSINSFKEIGTDFADGLKIRADKALDSPYDFANYWTLGVVETFKGAVNPDEPLSKEHWLNSIEVAGIIVGGTRVAIPKNGNINKNKTKPSQKIENKANKSNINKSKLPEGAGKDEFVDIYRAVGPDEYYDIMDNKMFRSSTRSLSGKQFGNSFDEILKLSDHLPDTSAIIKARIPKSVYKQLDHTPVDSFILKSGSVTVQPNKLDLFNNSLIEIKHMY